MTNYCTLKYVCIDFEDIMIMSSDEDIPALEDSPYWKNSGLH